MIRTPGVDIAGLGLCSQLLSNSLSQWLNFKLFGITYLVGKISRSNFFFQGPGRLSEVMLSI